MESDRIPMPREVARHLVAYAGQMPREEVCGFVLLDWHVEPVLNQAENPANTFKMDEEHLISAFTTRRLEVIGIFHSHPGGNPHPSDPDCYQWPYADTLRYWIIAGGDVYEWEIIDGIATPLDHRGTRGAKGLAYPLLAAPETL